MTLLKGFWDAMKPTPIITVSDWADKNRYLTSHSAEPGRWRTDRTPYLREPFDFLSANSPGQRSVIMKGHQLGFTEMGLNLVGYYIDIAPCPIMYLMPTLDNAKDLADTRFTPMITASPVLSDKIKPARERDSGNTKLMKKFAGGFVNFPGANSAASLASKAIRVLVKDETDRYPADVDGEGSPSSLAEKRQSTFGAKKKALDISTPGMEHTSVIEPAYLKTDQRKFMLPCPHCGSFQELVFEQLVYDKENIDAGVHYQCIESECGELIQERFKTTMLTAGRWEATKPELSNPFVRGYHINSLYSPVGWLSWIDIAKEWEDAQGDIPKLKSFINTILGQTYKEVGDVPVWESIRNRSGECEPNVISNDVYLITIGVDTQDDRLEYHVVGWGKNKVKYSIDYQAIVGDTGSNAPWDTLAEVLGYTWERPDGIIIPVRLMAIDTGGHRSSKVYAFCRRFDSTRVIPIKGSSNFDALMVTAPKSVDTTKAGVKLGKMKVWIIGVSSIKSEIYSQLKLEIKDGIVPQGYFYFPEYGDNFFRGLTGEQLVKSEDKSGFNKYEWKLKYRANEPLDTSVYARAAAAVVGIDRWNNEKFDAIIGQYTKIVKAQPKSTTQKNKPDKPERKRSKFWD